LFAILDWPIGVRVAAPFAGVFDFGVPTAAGTVGDGTVTTGPVSV
jgi:hypothetical protein